MKKQGIIIDIIKANNTIRDMLFRRIKGELKLSNRMVRQDAINLNFIIPESHIANYFNHDFPHNQRLSQENILWLCIRYGIRVSITSKTIPYRIQENIPYLKKFWPNTTILKEYELKKRNKENKNMKNE